MNFVGIILQLLITGICYKRGICQDPEIEYSIRLSSVRILSTETDTPLAHYSAPYLQKFKNEDTYYMHDIDDRTLVENFFKNDLFSSKQLEFVSMYGKNLIFLFQKACNRLYVLCKFSNKEDMQQFFDSVDPVKPKDDSMKIRKIAQYAIDDAPYSMPVIDLFVEDAVLSVRNFTNFVDTHGTTYYISHESNDADGKIELDLIFVSTRFRFSTLCEGNAIALCLTDVPTVRFIIRFSDDEIVSQFVSDYIIGGEQSNELCVFPVLTQEQIDLYL